ncbi:MAG TPA: Vms1/Ankzf1 family peptidyl-tRNA hydrolase [Bryobacteraceae bacterium]|nr:Vms1/Ankzf1 family peptidyl-tRNA hydrolase [Bryobacteraceae bacterium]
MPTLLDEQIDRLAAFPATTFPVITLYLNTQPDQHGRARYESFVRKELRGRSRTFLARSPERVSFDQDVDRIQTYLREELQPSTHGLAVFACSGENKFFEALQLSAPIDHHEIHVGAQPHLYTLARINDQYPRYAAVVADTNSARLFVFGLSNTLETNTVQNIKVNRTQMGGWSQARYQRHVDNYHLHHAKEVLDMLARVVREERIEHIIFAGDEVVIPILQQQLPPFLAEKVVDVLRLDITTPEHQILTATLEAMRRRDAETDAAKVERMIGEYRAGGLATVGARDVLAALSIGQVDELFLAASPDLIRFEDAEAQAARPDDLVAQARKTGATVTFIEDPNLLAEVGGVGATLRYRLEPTE